MLSKLALAGLLVAAQGYPGPAKKAQPHGHAHHNGVAAKDVGGTALVDTWKNQHECAEWAHRTPSECTTNAQFMLFSCAATCATVAKATATVKAESMTEHTGDAELLDSLHEQLDVDSGRVVHVDPDLSFVSSMPGGAVHESSKHANAVAVPVAGTAPARWNAPLKSLGPILVVYVTDSSPTGKPVVDKTQIEGLLYSSPHSVKELFRQSSWGQSSLEAKDVDFLTLPLNRDVTKDDLTEMRAHVNNNGAFREQFESRNYQHYVIVAPGSSFAATAYDGTRSGTNGERNTYSVGLVRGAAARSWSMWAHVLGHNLGLKHAGGYRTADGVYQEFQDDAAMGFARGRAHDMNVVSRDHLGWVAAKQTATYSAGATLVRDVRALNEGPRNDGKVLMMKAHCDFCQSINPKTSSITGGEIFLSFRTQDAKSNFGVASMSGLYSVDHKPVALAERVHVHFQPSHARHSEMWTSLAAGDSFKLPGSTKHEALYIKVCKVQATQFATVAISSSKSDADACTASKEEGLASKATMLAEGTVSAASADPAGGEGAFFAVVDWETRACTVTPNGKCITDGPGKYGNNERCTIKALHDLSLTATQYDVEDEHDYVTIGSEMFDKSSSPPKDVLVKEGDIFMWASDGSMGKEGFTICGKRFHETPSPSVPPMTPMSPPSAPPFTDPPPLPSPSSPPPRPPPADQGSAEILGNEDGTLPPSLFASPKPPPPPKNLDDDLVAAQHVAEKAKKSEARQAAQTRRLREELSKLKAQESSRKTKSASNHMAAKWHHAAHQSGYEHLRQRRQHADQMHAQSLQP